jgi:hypothetical protein
MSAYGPQECAPTPPKAEVSLSKRRIGLLCGAAVGLKAYCFRYVNQSITQIPESITGAATQSDIAPHCTLRFI